jgi:hypothetical protein
MKKPANKLATLQAAIQTTVTDIEALQQQEKSIGKELAEMRGYRITDFGMQPSEQVTPEQMEAAKEFEAKHLNPIRLKMRELSKKLSELREEFANERNADQRNNPAPYMSAAHERVIECERVLKAAQALNTKMSGRLSDKRMELHDAQFELQNLLAGASDSLHEMSDEAVVEMERKLKDSRVAISTLEDTITMHQKAANAASIKKQDADRALMDARNEVQRLAAVVVRDKVRKKAEEGAAELGITAHQFYSLLKLELGVAA